MNKKVNSLLSEKKFSFHVPFSHNGSRLDICISSLVEKCSRSYSAYLIRSGEINVDGQKNKKPSYKVNKGEMITGTLCEKKILSVNAEAIPLNIIYEDYDIIVINKKAGIVVHPSPGHSSGTLVNGILYHCQYLEMASVKNSIRPGIIHRLDKDTTGLIIIAKNIQSLTNVSSQFKYRTVHKEYLSIIYGVPNSLFGTITLPIGRHRIDRKKMSTCSSNPRSAETSWKVIEKYNNKTASLVNFSIKTGRTHQIRVHCKAINHPILGDPVYKNKGHKKELLKLRPDMARLINKTNRQMLHAYKIRLKHPRNGKQIEFKAKLPRDMINLIKILKKGNKASSNN